MAYKRKTRDRWDLESNYGYGWEVEYSSYTRKEAYQTLRDYVANVRNAGFRVVLRREKITDGKE